MNKPRQNVYRPYGLKPGEKRPLPPAKSQPDERQGWSRAEWDEYYAEQRAGVSRL